MWPILLNHKKFKEADMKVKEDIDQAGVFLFDCPGCKSLHAVHTITPNSRGALWEFNGNVDKPTFSPSIIVSWEYQATQQKHVCHSYVTDGKIQFLSDSTHSLAAQIVELPDYENW
jgi:hypothetical protein